MADRPQNPTEENRYADSLLVEILVDMVKSALEWEEDTEVASGREISGNQDSADIDYPPTHGK